MEISESWVDIPTWEGFYQISNMGRVRSLPRSVPRGDHFINLKGRMLRPSAASIYNYPSVGLKAKHLGRSETHRVHQLVASAFLPPKPEWAESICHNDGDNGNCKAVNIRWDTQSSNARDRVKHGRHHLANKDCCVRGHRLAPPNSPATPPRRCAACCATNAWAAWWKKKGIVRSESERQSHSDAYYTNLTREP